jgi:membrane protein YqaA with SNARE-associated domain
LESILNLHYDRYCSTLMEVLPRKLLHLLTDLFPLLIVAGVVTGLVITIVFGGSNLMQSATGLMGGKNVIKYEMIGLFLNSFFSSIIPIPTELATSILLLSKVNIILIFIILDTGSIVGGYLAYLMGVKYSCFIQRKLKDVANIPILLRLLNFLNRHSRLLLILSPWLPFVGESLYIYAGAAKYDLSKYMIYTSIGKSIKAAAIIALLASLILYL